MATNEEILFPKVIVIPTETPALSSPPVGALTVSGAKLYFYSGTSWELITSA